MQVDLYNSHRRVIGVTILILSSKPVLFMHTALVINGALRHSGLAFLQLSLSTWSQSS